MTDTLSPIYTGDTTAWTLNQHDRLGNVRSLAGISAGSIVVKLQSIDTPATVIIGGGTCAIAGDGTSGVLTYTPVSADVATPDTYWLYVIIPWTSGRNQHNDPYELEIKNAP